MNKSLRFHGQQILRAWHITWSSSRVGTLLSIALLVLQGALPLLSLYLYKLIIDEIERGLAGKAVPSFSRLALYIVAAACGALVANFANAFGAYVASRQANRVTNSLQKMLQTKSITLDLAHYDNPATLDIIRRAQDGSSSKPIEIINNLVTLAQNALSLLLLSGFLLFFHWSIALFLVLALLPGLLWQLRSADEIYKWHRTRTTSQRQATYWNWLLTSAQHAREVRLFGAGPSFMQRYSQVQERLQHEKNSLERVRATADFATQAISTLVVFLVFGYMALQTIQGLVTLGTLVVTLQAYQRAQGFLQNGIVAGMKLYESNLYLANVYEFLELPLMMNARMQDGAGLPKLRDSIRLEHVSYSYPNSSRPVLKDVNMTIRRGQVVAIVGENGAGKSTLVKLLCRFYEPTTGTITVDGHDLRNFPAAAWHDQVAAIFQDYIWYHQLTAGESIALGRVNEPRNESALQSAAQRSGADVVIAQLPMGYDNYLGNSVENGTELSIGQWQKIALARAFYRNAEILILDEPSSALDPYAEAEVFARFRQLTHNQTAILISHRLANVKDADQIFVLQDGCIVESGTHDDLIALGGAYQGLYETQARGYV